MRQAQSSPSLRKWFEDRPLARYAVTVALLAPIVIGIQELILFARPWTPSWVMPLFALCSIGFGLLMTIQRGRRPILEEETGSAWFDGPMFMIIGTLILIFNFAQGAQ